MTDAEEYGVILNSLVDKLCERSLATNSVKMRFDTADDPHGRQYIWIDPPWVFSRDGREVTSSSSYTEEVFEEWGKLFAPLNHTKFVGWHVESDGSTVFQFDSGYEISLPAVDDERDSNDWYLHWYASDAT